MFTFICFLILQYSRLNQLLPLPLACRVLRLRRQWARQVEVLLIPIAAGII
jgi:hypothetical protein